MWAALAAYLKLSTSNLVLHWKKLRTAMYWGYISINAYYYIDMSVLPKSRQLVFSIRNYIRDTSEIFSIFSLVKISLMSFLCFSSSFFLFRNTLIYVIKRKLHVDLNIWSLFSRGKKNFTRSLRFLVKYFFPLEDKLHMFAPPCNILSILMYYNAIYLMLNN